MKNIVTIEIDFGEDRSNALHFYAYLVGASYHLLGNRSPGFSFSGACVPNPTTMFRPAYVKVENDIST